MNSRSVDSSDINVDLWPSGAWSRDELEDFKDVVGEFGEVSGQISSDLRGIEVQVALAFAAGAIASGFFQKLGADLYSGLSSTLKDLLAKKEDNSGSDPPDVEGRLSLSYRDDVTQLYAVYACRYSNESELDTLFASVHPLNSLIVSARQNNSFPFDEGEKYDIHSKLQHGPVAEWKVRVRRYTTHEDKLIRNEFFNTRIHVDKLGGIEWGDCEWERRRGFIA